MLCEETNQLRLISSRGELIHQKR